MLSLNDFQKQFVQGLQSQGEAILQSISATKQLSPKERLAIYQGSIFGIKQKSLKEIYAVCNRLVGEDFFIGMVNEYITATPSTTPDLGGFGADFSDFIRGFQPAKCLPYLSDVARLEWVWHRLFYAPFADKLDFALLADVYVAGGEHIVFQLPPGCALLASPYPIHKIWEINQEDYVGDDGLVLPENAMFYLFVWRRGLKMRMDGLDQPTWQVMTWMLEGKSLSEMAEALDSQKFAGDFTQILTAIASWGWLTGFEIKRFSC
ncbi:MAG TPA: DNA-binding domain-containing protein [Gammaproteobacteria bacterium]|nr:DNA-binding domain-containing protein [Gammaproteobacteria bacterium]